MLRKNSIALDVVLFGDESHSTETHKKFEEMVKCANSAENSRLIHVKAGSSIIKALEPIFFPSLIEETNPSQEENELAMALQMSLEESRKQHLSEKTATDSADEKKETKSHTTASLKQKQNEKEMKKKRPSSKSAEELAKDMASNLQAEEKVEPMTDDKEEMNKMLKDRDFVQELLDTLPEVEKAEIDVEKLINDVMKEHDEKKDEKKK